MTKKYVKNFDSELEKLFRARTHWLKSLIRKAAPGKAPKFNRKKVQKSIITLQEGATAALLHSKLIPSASDLYDQKAQWHPKMGKGKGVIAKARAFKEWYDRKIESRHCVYIFWQRRNCLYIGRTLNGKGRPSSHFQKFWFSKATRLDVLAFRNKRIVPMVECIATHKYQPKYSRIKPSKAKWRSKCPICEVGTDIRQEIKQIFRLR